jgi:hypothetical protein
LITPVAFTWDPMSRRVTRTVFAAPAPGSVPRGAPVRATASPVTAIPRTLALIQTARFTHASAL